MYKNVFNHTEQFIFVDMNLSDILSCLNELAPPSLQESYDNSGLLTGNPIMQISGILVSLDCTEQVLDEAQRRGCNLIVCHHPVIFRGIKRLTGSNYVERIVMRAIRENIAIYSIHTNLDNVLHGVNGKMASMLGLTNCRVLRPKENVFYKLEIICPADNAVDLRNALFKAGAGQGGRYSDGSFSQSGLTTFKPLEGAEPVSGEIGTRYEKTEIRYEFIVHEWKLKAVLEAIRRVHPYTQPAYFLYPVVNTSAEVGSGLIGMLPKPEDSQEFLQRVKHVFGLQVLKHTDILKDKVLKVALCGGAGVFLLPDAMKADADVFLTSDIKYHEFFDADGNILMADLGHYESEQFTSDLLAEVLSEFAPELPVMKARAVTNPVRIS
jgi:dinuclear metal center YbgI/SA1388 family protein